MINVTRPFLLLALALVCGRVQATTYYTSKSGSDANPGTQSQPWLTVQNAAQHVVAGDTVNIGAGSYDEIATISANGTSGSPITFIGPAGALVAGIFCNGNYIIINGLSLGFDTYPFAVELSGTGDQFINGAVDCKGKVGTTSSGAVQINGSNCLMQNCNVTGVSLTAVVVMGGNNDVVAGCTFHDMADVWVFHLWGNGSDIKGNEVYNISNPTVSQLHADFIQTFGSTPPGTGLVSENMIIEDNYVHDCTSQSGCQIGNITCDNDPKTMGPWIFRNNVFCNISNSLFVGIPTLLYNNVFYNCGIPLDGNDCILFYQQSLYNSVGSQVVNNAFIGSGPIGSSTANLASLLLDHNFFASDASGSVTNAGGGSFGTNSINSGNPLFTNTGTGEYPSAENFHITAGSPLANAGISPSLPSWAAFAVDKDGVSRPQGAAWSVGPYEFLASGTAPAQPQNFRKTK
jgi:hypothetical protein